MVKKVPHFLLGTLVLLSIGLFFVLTNDKIGLHFTMNSYNSPFLDFFFRYFTNIGDGAFAVFFLPLFFFFTKIRTLLFTLFGCLIAGILAQVLKKLVFVDALRPTALIDPSLLHTVEGVKLATMHSFPSGHGASAFAFMLCLALLNWRSKPMQYFFLLCAALGALSRVYLSQHFLMDTLAGAFVGCLSVFIGYAIAYRMKRLPDTTLYSYLRAKLRPGKLAS